MMMKRRGRASGYILNELLLAVAAVSMLAAASGGAYMYMKRAAQADDTVMKVVTLVNDTRRAYLPLASFSTISATGLSKMGLVQQPLYTDGTTLYDPWSNPVSVAGADTYFAVLMGGNGVMSAMECTTLVTGIQSAAYEVRVGAAAALGTGAAVGRTTGGYAYKTDGGTFSASALESGCSEANTKIAFSFDG
jgi:type II secretory pathway pseudopilin PulG